MSNYVNKTQKLKDTISTAVTFCIVGILGIIFLIFLDLELLPFHLISSNKIMFSIVLGIVFVFFIIVGLINIFRIKNLIGEAIKQENDEGEIIEHFINTYLPIVKAIEPNDFENDQDLFFERNKKIEELLKSDHPDMPYEDIEHFAEEIYEKIF